MSAAQPAPSGGTGGADAAGQAGPTAAGEPAGEVITQIRRLRLRGVSGTVVRARDFTRRALHDWGWLPAPTRDRAAAAEDVLLVVSELVTNACLHAAGPDELRICAGPKVLRIEVTDPAPDAPAPRAGRTPGRPGGHGIFIVQRLCLDWGVARQPDGDGKTVWAELAAPGQAR